MFGVLSALSGNPSIKICSSHADYPVPLIWTFAFIGAEYWCPHCGYTGGMMGAGENVEPTAELIALRTAFTKLSKPFLHARAMTGRSGAEQVKFNGQWVTPDALPAEERAAHEAALQAWTYHQKPEPDYSPEENNGADHE